MKKRKRRKTKYINLTNKDLMIIDMFMSFTQNYLEAADKLATIANRDCIFGSETRSGRKSQQFNWYEGLMDQLSNKYKVKIDTEDFENFYRRFTGHYKPKGLANHPYAWDQAETYKVRFSESFRVKLLEEKEEKEYKPEGWVEL